MKKKTHQLRDLDVGLEIALERAEEDLALARLEPVDHAGDGAVVCFGVFFFFFF